jgi:hypothetical protein
VALVEKLSSSSSMTKYQKMSALLVNGDQNPRKDGAKGKLGLLSSAGKADQRRRY